MRKLLTLAVSSLTLAGFVQAQSLQTLDKHVHGEASLKVALEDQDFQIELDTPAINLIGFEYEPKTDTEKAKVKKASELLDNPVNLFGVNLKANCSLVSKSIEIKLASASHDHPHDDDDDEHDHDGHDHGDIEAQYKFKCTSVKELKGLDLTQFFTNFAQTEKVDVELVFAEAEYENLKQDKFELNAKKTKFNW